MKLARPRHVGRAALVAQSRGGLLTPSGARSASGVVPPSEVKHELTANAVRREELKAIWSDVFPRISPQTAAALLKEEHGPRRSSTRSVVKSNAIAPADAWPRLDFPYFAAERAEPPVDTALPTGAIKV